MNKPNLARNKKPKEQTPAQRRLQLMRRWRCACSSSSPSACRHLRFPAVPWRTRCSSATMFSSTASPSRRDTSWMPLIPYHQIQPGRHYRFLQARRTRSTSREARVGVPGDRLHLRDGVLYVNGVGRMSPTSIHSLGNYDPYRDNFPSAAPGPYDQLTLPWRAALPQQIQGGDLVVPANSYFAMGDNRDDSLDSRYWGFVPRENIVGSPLFIYWSFKTPRDEYLKESIPDRIAYATHVIMHFVDETRWNRMLRPVSECLSILPAIGLSASLDMTETKGIPPTPKDGEGGAPEHCVGSANPLGTRQENRQSDLVVVLRTIALRVVHGSDIDLARPELRIGDRHHRVAAFVDG